MNNLFRSNNKNKSYLNYNNNFSRSNFPVADTKNEHKKLCFKTIKCNTITFKSIKNNTISSLNDVECFLNNMNKFWHYVKLYKLLR